MSGRRRKAIVAKLTRVFGDAPDRWETQLVKRLYVRHRHITGRWFNGRTTVAFGWGHAKTSKQSTKPAGLGTIGW